jgi:16S rRNA (adenine1518-N6/adenine1519-N6)-dimethyltransferase
LFFHRRKFLRSQLATALQEELDKSEVDQVLESCGLAPSLRAEQLSVEQIIQMLEACRLRVEAKKQLTK